MSRVVDERVVSMQFDNKKFEANVATSMSTLDKLKQKLNLSGASKGLEEVNAAAGKVNMNGLAKGVETVQAKFTALQVVGVTALTNIANSAVNAAKRLVHSLAIAPITDGFKEYELMLNSIQTTMAGTGKTAKEVELELQKLDAYADKTVYSTSDMLTNLPKFTNAGIELEKATTAMIGIANATALAGGDANKASIAYYNLGQAISTGYLTRMDYNSINNAGIATMEWKKQMVEAAVAAGTLKKAGEDAYVAGNKTFSLQQLFIEGLQEQWATADVMMKVFEDYGNEQTEIGKKAYAAAQDIKTYTQMMESLKATAGTGWKDTWQLIFGDLDGAKKFWTGLTNAISGVITRVADIRNKILEVAMGSPLANMAEKIENITDKVKSATKPLKDYAEVVDRIIRGDFGNQGDKGDKDYRKKGVEKAGYDYATAQNLVNEKLGVSVRLTSDLKEEQEELNTQQTKTIDQLAEMSEKQLKSLGYTDDQIDAIKTLAKHAKAAGVPLSEFIKNLDEMTGREMLIESFKNVGKGLVTVFQTMKDAFLDIFPISAEDIGLRIYSVLTRIYEFTKKFDISKNADTIDKLTRTFKGLFAALDILLTILGSPIKIAFKLLSQLLGVFDLDILTVTAKIGDAIVKFHDWFESIFDLTEVFEKLKPYIEDGIQAVKDWYEAAKPLEKIAGFFKKISDAIKNLAQTALESDIGQNIIDGLTNGLRGGVEKVWNAIVELARGMIAKIKEVLGIHSPSTEFREVGENAIDGLILGLKDGFGAIGDVIKALCEKMGDIFNGFDWNVVSNTFMNLAKLFPTVKIFSFISGLGGLFSIGGKDMMAGLANGISAGASAVWSAITAIATTLIEKFRSILQIHSPSKVFFAIGGFIIAGLIGGMLGGSGNIKDALSKIGDTILNFFKNLDIGTVIAASVGIASVLMIKKVLDIISNFSSAAKGVGRLTDSLGGLADAISSRGLKGLINGSDSSSKASQLEVVAKALLKIAVAIGLVAAVVVVFAKMDIDELKQGGIALLLMSAMIVGLVAALLAVTKKLGNGTKIARLGSTLLMITGAMAIMAIIAKIAGSMYWEDMGKAAVAIIGLGGIIVALMAATKLLSRSTNVDKIGGSLMKVAGALIIMAIVAKIAGSMEWSDIGKAAVVIAGFSGIIIALMAATKLINGSKNVDKIGGALFKIAGAIAIMMIVAKIAASMSLSEIVKGVSVIAAFSGIIIALMAATKLINKSNNVKTIGGAIFKIAGAIAVMMIVVKIAASMSMAEITKGMLAIYAFCGMIVGLMAATKLLNNSKNVDKIGGSILMIAGGIALMAIAAKIAASMSLEEIAKGTAVIAAFAGLIVGFIALTKNVLKDASGVDKVGPTILMMAAAIGIMSASVALLSLIDPAKLAGATLAISALVASFALVTKMASGVGKDSLGSLIVLTVAIGILSYALYQIAELPIENALASSAALSVLMLSMAGTLHIISSLGKQKAKDALIGAGLLVLMAVPLLAFVGVLALMSNIENATNNALALTILATAMSLLLIVLTAVGQFGTSGAPYLGVLALLTMAVPLLAFVGILALMQNVQNAMANTDVLIKLATAMTLLLIPLTIIGAFGMAGLPYLGVLALLTMAVPLIAFVGVLAAMQNIQNAMANTDVLIKLATAMTLLLIPLTIIGAFGMAGLPYLGVLALLTMAVPLLAFVGVLALMQNIQNAEHNANLLIKLATAMTAVLVALALIGPLALSGIAAIVAMTQVIIYVGALAAAIGALMELFPSLQTFLDTGINVMIQIAGGIGEMIGAFIGGVMTQIASTLPAIGICLSAFMMNLMPFIQGVKLIDDQVLKGIGILVAAVAALTVSSLITSISNFISLGSSFTMLGLQLSAFIFGAMPFITGVKQIDPATMEGVKTLADAVIVLTGANLISGISKFLGISGDLASFGGQLVVLGESLRSFVDKLGTFSEEQITTVNCAAKAIKILAEASQDLPTDGGIWASLFGENSLASFGAQLPGFATNLKAFMENLGTFDESKVTTVDCAGKAIKALAEAAKEIPADGSIWTSIFGDNSLASFGAQLPGFATNLKSFMENLGTFDESKVTTVNCAGQAIKALADVAKDLPTDGGIWTSIFGDNSISAFGSQLPELGTNLKGFVDNLGTFDDGKVATVNSVVKAINAFAKIGDENIDPDNISDLGKKLNKFAEQVEDFSDKMSNVSTENITAATGKLETIVSTIKKITTADFSAAKSFGDTLESLAKSGVDKFVTGFTGSSSKESITNAADTLIKTLTSGLEKKNADVKKSGEASGKKAAEGMGSSSNKSAAEQSGKDLGSGLIKGIEAKYQAAYNAGYKLGQKAVQGEKDGQQSKSPSKLTILAGKWLGEGLIIGMDKMGAKVYKSGRELGETATSSLSSIMARVADTLSSDMDTTPTIRPVLDLSDVEAGASMIGGMFGTRATVGVAANVNAVNNMMRGRQNGNFSDVVDAIDRLDKHLDNVGNTTYSVNGVTYDDGSNVHDAVKSLVRAVRIERRT